MLEKNPI